MLALACFFLGLAAVFFIAVFCVHRREKRRRREIDSSIFRQHVGNRGKCRMEYVFTKPPEPPCCQ